MVEANVTRRPIIANLNPSLWHYWEGWNGFRKTKWIMKQSFEGNSETCLTYGFYCCEETPWPQQLLYRKALFTWILSTEAYSIVIKAGSMVACRQTVPQGLRVLHPSGSAGIRKRVTLGLAWTFETLKATTSDPFPQTNSHSLQRSHSSQCHSLSLQLYESMRAVLIQITTAKGSLVYRDLSGCVYPSFFFFFKFVIWAFDGVVSQ